MASSTCGSSRLDSFPPFEEWKAANGLSGSTKARGPWIQINPSCGKFYLATPRPEEIRINDVAWHLAGINRYTGGSRITVAQHCVVASRMARRHYPGEHYLAAKMLIHDSHESFYGDASSPFKSLLPDYRYYEALGEAAFEKRFDLNWLGDPLVKEIDRRVMFAEREKVFATPLPWDDDWSMDIGMEPFPFVGDDGEPWGADKAETEWLHQFYYLLPWVQW